MSSIFNKMSKQDKGPGQSQQSFKLQKNQAQLETVGGVASRLIAVERDVADLSITQREHKKESAKFLTEAFLDQQLRNWQIEMETRLKSMIDGVEKGLHTQIVSIPSASDIKKMIEQKVNNQEYYSDILKLKADIKSCSDSGGSQGVNQQLKEFIRREMKDQVSKKDLIQVIEEKERLHQELKNEIKVVQRRADRLGKAVFDEGEQEGEDTPGEHRGAFQASQGSFMVQKQENQKFASLMAGFGGSSHRLRMSGTNQSVSAAQELHAISGGATVSSSGHGLSSFAPAGPSLRPQVANSSTQINADRPKLINPHFDPSKISSPTDFLVYLKDKTDYFDLKFEDFEKKHRKPENHEVAGQQIIQASQEARIAQLNQKVDELTSSLKKIQFKANETDNNSKKGVKDAIQREVEDQIQKQKELTDRKLANFQRETMKLEQIVQQQEQFEAKTKTMQDLIDKSKLKLTELQVGQNKSKDAIDQRISDLCSKNQAELQKFYHEFELFRKPMLDMMKRLLKENESYERELVRHQDVHRKMVSDYQDQIHTHKEDIIGKVQSQFTSNIESAQYLDSYVSNAMLPKIPTARNSTKFKSYSQQPSPRLHMPSSLSVAGGREQTNYQRAVNEIKKLSTKELEVIKRHNMYSEIMESKLEKVEVRDMKSHRKQSSIMNSTLELPTPSEINLKKDLKPGQKKRTLNISTTPKQVSSTITLSNNK